MSRAGGWVVRRPKALMADLLGRGLGALRGIFSSSPSGSHPPAHRRRLFLAETSELQNGQMKEIQLEAEGRNFKVLLSRVQDQFYATSHLCPHYRARLVTGTLSSDGRLGCPWHAACFSVRTGDIEEAPSLEALKSYPVAIEDAKVYLEVQDETEFETSSRAVCGGVQITDEEVRTTDKTLVILGGGAAGAVAAESIRQAGFKGRITVISKEHHLPIDRIKLSKVLDSKPERLYLYAPSYLDQLKIDFVLSKTAMHLDKEKKEIVLDDGLKVTYDKLLISTGGEPRRLPIPGNELANVFVIREIQNNENIRLALERFGDRKPKVVIIGASFIGMEAAAMMSKVAESVTVVGAEQVPLERVLGATVGNFFRRLHEKNGVRFQLGVGVSALYARTDAQDEVGGVELATGSRVEADLVIVGVGVSPRTQFCQGSLELERDGSIKVDQYMRVRGEEDIFAAGDIVTFPHYKTSEPVRIEHWDVAQQQGRIAGHNMAVCVAGSGSVQSSTPSLRPYRSVPFFFSLMFGKSVRYAGDAHQGYDEVIIHGDVEAESPAFAAYYVRGDEVLAVATVGRDPLAVHCSELFRQGRMPSTANLKSGMDPLAIAL